MIEKAGIGIYKFIDNSEFNEMARMWNAKLTKEETDYMYELIMDYAEIYNEPIVIDSIMLSEMFKFFNNEEEASQELKDDYSLLPKKITSTNKVIVLI